jgi:hypothetical protein
VTILSLTVKLTPQTHRNCLKTEGGSSTALTVDTLAGLENLALKHETRREAILTDLMRAREGRRPDERLAEYLPRVAGAKTAQ